MKRRPPLRSHIHMLIVAAARIERDHGNPKLIADLREAAAQEAGRIAEGCNWSPEEDRRAERQRTLFNMLPSSTATDRLKAAMLQRAYDLMWDGRCTECDALTEFLPSADVEEMFAWWEKDQEPGGRERSRYYEGTAFRWRALS